MHAAPTQAGLELGSRRAELERLGYRIVQEDATSLMASRSKWHWECFLTKLTMLVLVRRVPHVTADQIAADERYLHDNATALDPSALPRGFQKGRAFVAVYLTDQADPTALARVQQKPSLKVATFFMPALRTAAGQSAYCTKTPIFGAIYYWILQWLIARMLNPVGTPNEPISKLGLGLMLALPAMTCPCFCLLSAIGNM